MDLSDSCRELPGLSGKGRLWSAHSEAPEKELRVHTEACFHVVAWYSGSLTLTAFESAPVGLLRAAVPAFQVLPAWKPGVLEIHQIATNRGNSALLLLPDGTTMMIDAGAIYGALTLFDRSSALRPASPRRVDWALRKAASGRRWTHGHRFFPAHASAW